MHDILIRYMTKEVVEDICGSLGEVNQFGKHPTEEGGIFMRVRVIVNVTKPLCRGRVMHLEERGGSLGVLQI